MRNRDLWLLLGAGAGIYALTRHKKAMDATEKAADSAKKLFEKGLDVLKGAAPSSPSEQTPAKEREQETARTSGDDPPVLPPELTPVDADGNPIDFSRVN